jgi:hypothetical protein
MRYVEFDPQTLTGDERTFWADWIKRSERAKKKASEQHSKNEKIKFNQDVWKQLKDWLLKHVFYGKCSYCEGKYIAGTYDAAEHWRPKGMVTIDGVEVSRPDGTRNRGYWWLAYDWRNLVPSCDRCNGQGGKMNEFPVGKSHVFDPDMNIDELDAKEDPLLLHPYDAKKKPEDHLKFGLQGVVAEDKSSGRGKESIRVFNLKRPELNEERAEEQEKSEDRWLRAVNKLAEEGIPIAVTMSSFTGPKSRYSQAVKAYIEHKKEDFVKLLLG